MKCECEACDEDNETCNRCTGGATCELCSRCLNHCNCVECPICKVVLEDGAECDCNGWGWPANSKKAHFFINSRSLCCKWLYSGHLEHGNDDSSDNCAECKRRKAKLK